MQRKFIFIVAILTILCLDVAGQSPITNRIEAVIGKLPKEASVAARYTDRHRHCVYYVDNNRLYRFDVCTDRREEIPFPKGYLKILYTCVGQQGSILFVVVDRGTLCGNYAVDGQALYAVDTYRKTMRELATGFSIHRDNIKKQSCLTVKKAYRCIDSARQRWQAQNHHYDMTGTVIYTSEPYTVRIEKKQ